VGRGAGSSGNERTFRVRLRAGERDPRIAEAWLGMRMALLAHERGDTDAALEACAAHYAARRAATEAAHTCHQVFGAVGITLEGPAFHLSRKILQLAAMAPGVEATTEALYAGIHRRTAGGEDAHGEAGR